MNDPTPTVEATSKPPQRFRRTLIAVSVFFGVMAVAFTMLLVRSYWVNEVVSHANSAGVLTVFGSGTGRLYFVKTTMPLRSHGWQYSSTLPRGFGDYRWKLMEDNLKIVVPIWLLAPWAAIAAFASYVPLGKSQFSLRTMLVATTLVAVVLGLVVWMMK